MQRRVGAAEKLHRAPRQSEAALRRPKEARTRDRTRDPHRLAKYPPRKIVLRLNFAWKPCIDEQKHT